jgi:HK97 family phage prohead protease
MATIDTSEEVRGSAPKNPPRENLVRATTGITLERADGATMPTLTGHFAVWDQWTEIRSAYEGNFMERFSPGAMTKTLSESTPKVLFQHGRDNTVGDKPLGAVTRLEPDATGAFYEVALLDTSYNRDLLPGLEAGLYGASFRFSVVREDVVQRPAKTDYNPRGIPERTVQEARVAEFGPVTFPAYAAATAGIRSMTDEFLFDALVEDPERLRELLRSARIDLAEIFLEPEEPAPTTPEPDEPEPSVATTRSGRDLFLFTTPPSHLKAS